IVDFIGEFAFSVSGPHVWAHVCQRVGRRLHCSRGHSRKPVDSHTATRRTGPAVQSAFNLGRPPLIRSVRAAPPPQAFQRAMVFIDGTNLFYRLQPNRLRLKPNALTHIGATGAGGREIVRTYLYTSAPHLERARKDHDPEFANNVRIIEGDAIPKNGGFKEK